MIPGYKSTMLSETAIAEKVKELSIRYVYGVCKYITQNKLPVSITSDGWSHNEDSFQTITLHFVYNGNIVNMILTSLNQVDEESTFFLQYFLRKSILNNDLSDALVGVTTSNSWKIACASQGLCADTKMSNLDPVNGSLGCLIHILSLAIKSFISALLSKTTAVTKSLAEDDESEVLFEENSNLLEVNAIDIQNQSNAILEAFSNERTSIEILDNPEQGTDVLNLMNRINMVLSKLNDSSRARVRYQRLLVDCFELRKDNPICHIQAYVPTRWNTCYLALDSLLKNREILSFLYDETGDKVYKFSDSDFDAAAKCNEFIGVAIDLMKLLSKESTNISIYLPCLIFLMLKFEKFRRTNAEMKDEQFSNAADMAIKKVQKYYNKVKDNPLAIIAACFTKSKNFPAFKASSEQQAIMESFLVNWYLKEESATGTGSSSNAQREQIQNLALFRQQLIEENENRRSLGLWELSVEEQLALKISTTKFSTELDRVLHELPGSHYLELVGSKYYLNLYYENESFRNQYPIFVKLMKRLLVIQATSLSSERISAASKANSTNQRFNGVKKASEFEISEKLMNLESIFDCHGLPFSKPSYFEATL